MRFGFAVRVVAFCALIWGGAMVGTATAADAPLADPAAEAALLCGKAPTDFVKPVPSPFNLWVVLVCGPQSQALVPVEGMVWLSHGTNEAVSILALPPDAMPLPKTDEYDPSYGVRFKSLFSTEVKDEKLKRAISILETAQANSKHKKDVLPASQVEHVFQLDAVSNIYDMRYNIFFFIRSNVPQAAIVCIDGCSKFLYFDILTSAEAKKRNAAIALRP
tara:strand:+ start:462 stop:1118 length:657 start_codon:yes stop_codon:yes gene_type:complete